MTKGEQVAKNVGDMISRQAAIEWCLEGLNNMPSAQPEIIHCRDCKHHHYDSKGIPYCDRIDYGYGWKDDDYCSMGEKENR